MWNYDSIPKNLKSAERDGAKNLSTKIGIAFKGVSLIKEYTCAVQPLLLHVYVNSKTRKVIKEICWEIFEAQK